jgi:nucleoside-diphosphate-sugar epimerase
MKVLLTGASGFVGMATLQALLGKGAEIIATSTSGKDITRHDHVEWRQWDAAPDGCVPSGIDYASLDAIIHLASPRERKEFPQHHAATFNTNVTATVNLAAVAAQHNLQFVLASTGDVFARGPATVSEEETRWSPNGFYGSTKASAEILLQPFAELTTITVMRIFHPYGPGGDNFLVNRLLTQIVNDKVITLEKEGGILVNPIWIDDLAEGICQAVFLRTAGTFHLAGKETLTLEQLVSLMADVTSRQVQLDVQDALPPGGHAGKISRTAKTLEFEPATDLRTGIALLMKQRQRS